MKQNQTLLSSAKDFIIESLINYRDGKLNFAILHGVSAAELILKEKLAQVHPNLIYRNIDSKNLKNAETARLCDLPVRLMNLGVKIQFKELKLVETLAKWRNQIVHHMPDFERDLAKLQLTQLLDFLAKILKRELKAPLESFLPQHLFKTVNGLLKEWDCVVDEARGKAKTEGNVLNLACPNCGTTSVVCLRNNKRVFCHLCNAKHYYYEHCTQCDRKVIGTFSTFDEGNCCDECIDAAGEHYAEMLSEIERGK